MEQRLAVMPTRDVRGTRVEKRNAFVGVHSSDLDAHRDGAVCFDCTG